MSYRIVAIACVLALSACGGGSGGTPTGFVRAQGTKVSVAHPKDWQKAQPQGKLVTASAQGQSGRAEVDVMENLSSSASEDGLVDIVQGGPMMQFAGYRRRDTTPIDVTGAQAAVRIDYAYNAKLAATGPANTPAQGVDVAILGRDNHVHAVRLTWQRGKLDDKTVDGIVDSIRVS
jgi:hypothetical protein